MGRLLASYSSESMCQEDIEEILDCTFISLLQQSCPYKLYLNFYGLPVCLRSQSQQIHSEFEFIFEMFKGDDVENYAFDIEFFFVIENPKSSSLKLEAEMLNLTWTSANYCHDDITKAVYRKTRSKFLKLQRYDKWPTDMMVLPPFNLEPLNHQFIVIEGNSLINRDGKTCLIVGAWWQGKTTLTTLLLERGYTFLSDGLIVLDRQTFDVKKYSTLCAFRHYNIPELGNFGNALVAHPKTTRVESPNTGLIYLNQFSNFFPVKSIESSPPNFIALCNKAIDTFNSIDELDDRTFLQEIWNRRVECGLSRDKFLMYLLSLHKITNTFRITYSNLSEAVSILDEKFHSK
jgi:hypothetical protein